MQGILKSHNCKESYRLTTHPRVHVELSARVAIVSFADAHF